jgi:hypothetical protein
VKSLTSQFLLSEKVKDHKTKHEIGIHSQTLGQNFKKQKIMSEATEGGSSTQDNPDDLGLQVKISTAREAEYQKERKHKEDINL